MARIVRQHAVELSDVGPGAGWGSTGDAKKSARWSGMNLSSVSSPAWNTIRGVRFAMRYGPTLIAVLVTHAALEAIARIPAGAGGYLARFEKHRDALEKAASAKHQRGELEEDGAVIVQPGDVKSLTP